VRHNLEFGLGEAIGAEQLKRESWWTESLAVGRPGFLEKVRPMIPSRTELKNEQEQEGLWVLKEPEIPYNAIPASKSAANGRNHGSDETQQSG
jgi:putative transposase